MSTAVLSLGSNMADPAAQLTVAVRRLGPVLRAVSSMYRTPPWGPVEQDDFLNVTAIVADAATDASGWLARAHELERQAQRERLVRWGPRTLDVDVIAVWDGAGVNGGAAVLSDEPDLLLPHPRAQERAFVLLPWAEIDPDAVLPTRGRVADLLAGLDTSGIERVGRCGG